MAKPIWETGYNLGSFYTGQLVNIQLLAIPVLPALSITTYMLTNGTLPSGLTFLTTGYIVGTLSNPTSQSVQTVAITVQATDNLGNTSVKSFTITFYNYLAQPTWNTLPGSLGNYPALVPLTLQLSATAVSPATSVSYSIQAGNLPSGLNITETGLIYGTPAVVSTDVTSNFTIRVTSNIGTIRDRTFSMLISGSSVPEFITNPGTIINTLDSVWIEYPIQYSNPISSNVVTIRLVQGELPPGLEINDFGLIRGYCNPPIVDISYLETTTSITQANANILTGLSTSGFRENRSIMFSGSVFTGLVAGQTYYIKSVINSTQFTITETINGSTLELVDQTGFMDCMLPTTTVGQPTRKNYNFTLSLESDFGSDSASYNIIVTNQNMPTGQGGPGYLQNSRVPTIYNTRPPIFNTSILPTAGYYLVPENSNGITYQPSQFAYIGQLTSGNDFNFRILGHDFDDISLVYNFVGLPLGLSGNSSTGWITGTPIIADDTISEFSFKCYVSKANNITITSPTIGFTFKVANQLNDTVVWLTDNDLGTVYNGSICILKVEAEAEVVLSYTLTSGSLPPGLTLLSNGEISGQIAWQPNSYELELNDSTTFTFTVKAYSEIFAIISSTKTFTVQVNQIFSTPSDVLYIQAAPSVADRVLLSTLLDNNTLIPPDYLYRASDPRFGKATNIIYAHAYGIDASSFDEYIAAVTKNHYWRSIILGSLSTAVAKDSNGNIIYEVVYSNIIDNLINPQGVSIQEEIIWPRKINLFKGPWYTSVTNIHASYIQINPTTGNPTYYTSLTPGYVKTLYPNSLPNMRNRVGQTLGVQENFRLLPQWMISQQADGNTLGFTPAWVICYCKPGTVIDSNGNTVSYATQIKNNIENNWKNPAGQNYVLNQINFQIDRFLVDKSSTYNFDNNLVPPAWLTYPSAQPVPSPVNSKDFYVLFPRQTILPSESEYS